MGPDRLVMYATAYPGPSRSCRPGLSLRGQTDRDFDLCIGVDGFQTRRSSETLDESPTGRDCPSARRLTASPGAWAAIATLLDRYDGVIFVDVDDELLPPGRHRARPVANVGRDRLQASDHGSGRSRSGSHLSAPSTGRTLANISRAGTRLGCRTRRIARRRSAPACRCTKTVSSSTGCWRPRLAHGSQPGVRSRTAHALSPVSWQHSGCPRAEHAGGRSHRDRPRTNALEAPAPRDTHGAGPRQKALLNAQAAVSSSPAGALSPRWRWKRYVTRLNALPRRYLWWWSVAHPELEHLWTP